MISNSEKQRISNLNQELYSIARGISVLKYLRWDIGVKHTFLQNNATILPKVSYQKTDFSDKLISLEKLRNQLQGTSNDQWILGQIETLTSTLNMLQSVGTSDFYRHSCDLYGAANDALLDGKTTSLNLAKKFKSLLDQDYNVGQKVQLFDATATQQQMETRVNSMFGKRAPSIEISENIASNASASINRIRLRENAQFTQRDIEQLMQHEAAIHVATGLNGKNQKALPMFASSHAGTTRTQEGLAVFAEFITGTMDVNRMRRLSDRMIAIQMASEGADFIEVYNYFLKETEGAKDQSFDNTQRVFRGGLINGGAPFTKDIVYLDGLVRVHNFMRAAVMLKRTELIPLLFVGKVDLDDISIIDKLNKSGLCEPAMFVPSWVEDMSFLFSYMAYSGFLNSIDLEEVADHYEEILKR